MFPTFLETLNPLEPSSTQVQEDSGRLKMVQDGSRRLKMRKWKQNRIEEILASNSSLVSGLPGLPESDYPGSKSPKKVRKFREHREHLPMEGHLKGM